MHLVAGCQCTVVRFFLIVICHKLFDAEWPLLTFMQVCLHQHMVAGH